MSKPEIPESALITLNSAYSTTRSVTYKQPEIINTPADKIHTVLFLPENAKRKAEGGLRTQGYFKDNHEGKPLISVITVVFNGAAFLEQTIKSVIGQTYDNVEYIIIDGGSTDNTLDIIRQYEEQIDYWVSELDEGISDAFNKGISCASGLWLNILNSGDFYTETSLFLEVFNSCHNTKIITGFSQYSNTQNLIPKRILHNSNFLPIRAMISHQASFVRREIYKKFGGYNKEYKVRMDYEFWVKTLKENSFYFVPKVFVNYLAYGESYKSVDQFVLEGVKINFRYLSFLVALFLSLSLIFKQAIRAIQRAFNVTY